MDLKASKESAPRASVFLFVLIIVLLCGLCSGPVFAQTFLLEEQAQGKGQCSLRYMRPGFADDVEISTFSGIYDLAVSVSVRPGVHVVGSVPFIVANYRHNRDRSGIGNIYLGIRHYRRGDTGRSSTESIGLYFPTVGTNTLNWFGYLTNFQQQHKYLSKTLTLSGTYTHRRIWQGGGLFGFEIGPDLWIPIESEHRDGEILLHYGLDGGFRMDRLTIVLEVIGLALVTEDWDDLGDLVKHAAVLGAQWDGGWFRPGVFYQLYLEDDLRDRVDGVLGFKVEFVPE